MLYVVRGTLGIEHCESKILRVSVSHSSLGVHGHPIGALKGAALCVASVVVLRIHECIAVLL